MDTAPAPRAFRLLALIAASPLICLAAFFLLVAFRAPVDVDPHQWTPENTGPIPRIVVSSPWSRNDGYATARAHLGGPQSRTSATAALHSMNQYLSESSKPVEAARSSSGSSDLVWPIESTYITSDFGRRSDPIHGHHRPHEGVDIRADEGTPVLAAAAGTVVIAEHSGRSGLFVKIDHGNDVYTRYAHLSELAVSAGDDVAAGQVIGLSGSTGRVTGPHLHFEVSEGGQPQDPLSYDWKLPDVKENPSTLARSTAEALTDDDEQSL